MMDERSLDMGLYMPAKRAKKFLVLLRLYTAGSFWGRDQRSRADKCIVKVCFQHQTIFKQTNSAARQPQGSGEYGVS